MVDQYDGTIELQRDPESLTTRGLDFGMLGQVPGLVVSAYKLIANKSSTDR